MSLDTDKTTLAAGLDFEELVTRYYRALYQFALSLTRQEAESCDLVQQTYYLWAKKGHQLRDATKVKAWLFTTLHREFLRKRRHDTRFPHREMSEVSYEMPTIPSATVNQLDAATVMQALGRVDELYQAPVALFYLEDLPYKEIAAVLGVPIGTVQSRIARGKAQLRALLTQESATTGAQTGTMQHE